jgi:hypothetical protein
MSPSSASAFDILKSQALSLQLEARQLKAKSLANFAITPSLILNLSSKTKASHHSKNINETDSGIDIDGIDDIDRMEGRQIWHDEGSNVKVIGGDNVDDSPRNVIKPQDSTGFDSIVGSPISLTDFGGSLEVHQPIQKISDVHADPIDDNPQQINRKPKMISSKFTFDLSATTTPSSNGSDRWSDDDESGCDIDNVIIATKQSIPHGAANPSPNFVVLRQSVDQVDDNETDGSGGGGASVVGGDQNENFHNFLDVGPQKKNERVGKRITPMIKRVKSNSVAMGAVLLWESGRTNSHGNDVQSSAAPSPFPCAHYTPSKVIFDSKPGNCWVGEKELLGSTRLSISSAVPTVVPSPTAAALPSNPVPNTNSTTMSTAMQPFVASSSTSSSKSSAKRKRIQSAPSVISSDGSTSSYFSASEQDINEIKSAKIMSVLNQQDEQHKKKKKRKSYYIPKTKKPMEEVLKDLWSIETRYHRPSNNQENQYAQSSNNDYERPTDVSESPVPSLSSSISVSSSPSSSIQPSEGAASSLTTPAEPGYASPTLVSDVSSVASSRFGQPSNPSSSLYHHHTYRHQDQQYHHRQQNQSFQQQHQQYTNVHPPRQRTVSEDSSSLIATPNLVPANHASSPQHSPIQWPAIQHQEYSLTSYSHSQQQFQQQCAPASTTSPYQQRQQYVNNQQSRPRIPSIQFLLCESSPEPTPVAHKYNQYHRNHHDRIHAYPPPPQDHHQNQQHWYPSPNMHPSSWTPPNVYFHTYSSPYQHHQQQAKQDQDNYYHQHQKYPHY